MSEGQRKIVSFNPRKRTWDLWNSSWDHDGGRGAPRQEEKWGFFGGGMEMLAVEER